MAARKELSPDDWSAIAVYIKEEKERRAVNRSQLESLWSEVERQVRMEPLARNWGNTDKTAWYPELEMPQQYNALEVIAADVRRMLFPRETDWYDCNSNLSDKYLQRFNERRQKFPLIGSQPAPMQIDTETANVLVKTTIDHYHRAYDFLGNMDLCIAECLKYGTFAARVRQVKLTKFSHDYRGVNAEQVEGPALVPTTIRNTYLDDTAAQVMHEGMMTGPLTIYSYWQQLDDLKRAAKAGGKDKGWLLSKINSLTPKVNPQDDKKGQVELLFAEGDIIVPRSRDSIFLPNCWLTIAIGQREAQVVRFETNPMPFRSFVFGTYMRTDIDNPYGTSPLMKGQPVAEATTEIFCDFTASCRLNALPPVAYDRTDPAFQATAGPVIQPNALWGTDYPDKIIPQEIGDPAALMNAYLAAKKSYEELTGVTDPRRSAEVKSHTTAAAAAYQADMGMARTEDFVSSLESGPLTSMLYMEYAIAKQSLGKGQPVSVNADGIEGWVTVAGEDLPDDVMFSVTGSSGISDIKARNEGFVQATGAVIQLAQMAAAMGKPFDVDFIQLAKEHYSRAGVQNSDKFIKQLPAPDPNTPPPPDPAALQAQAQMQADQQKTAAQVKRDEEKLQVEAQLKQQELQQNGQIELHRIEVDRTTKLQLAELETAKALEVARINAKADLQQNIHQIVADVLTAAGQQPNEKGTTVVLGANGELNDMKQHGQAIADAAGKMDQMMAALNDNHTQAIQALNARHDAMQAQHDAAQERNQQMHQQLLAAINKPRKRKVTLTRGADGKAAGAVVEE